MGTVLGMDCNVFLNTGNYASPTWGAVEAVRNVTLESPHIMADASRRGSGGFKQYLATLKDVSLNIEMVWDKDDTAFVALYEAMIARTPVELAIVDGANESGALWLDAMWLPEAWPRAEELEGILIVDATYRIAPDANLVPVFGEDALPTTRS